MRAGWIQKSLGEICRIELGKTPPRKFARFWDDQKTTGNVWVSIADMPIGLHPKIFDSKEYVSDAGAKLGKIVPKDTLLVSFKLTLGRLAYAGCDLQTNEAIAALYLRDETVIETAYLYWYLTYFDWAKAAEGDEKIKGKTLNKEKLKRLLVVIPPLAEQRRIVAILNEAFAGIATAIANAERNLENARNLPSAVFADLNKEGSAKARLGDLVTRLTNGYVGPTRDIYVEAGIPYLLARHVKDDVLAFDEKTFVTPDFNEKNKKSKLATGDVLLVQSGHIGHSSVVPPHHAGHNCHAMIVITTKPELSGEYLSGYFNSLQGRRATAAIRSGSTVPHLTCKEVRELVIPLPSIDAQEYCVAAYRRAIESSRSLIQQYETKIENLSALRQSILAKAFRGELADVAQPVAA